MRSIMRWYSASEPSQYTTRSGFVSLADSSTQLSRGVATLFSVSVALRTTKLRYHALQLSYMPVTLWIKTPAAPESWSKWIRPNHQAHAKVGTFLAGQAGVLFVSATVY